MATSELDPRLSVPAGVDEFIAIVTLSGLHRLYVHH